MPNDRFGDAAGRFRARLKRLVVYSAVRSLVRADLICDRHNRAYSQSFMLFCSLQERLSEALAHWTSAGKVAIDFEA